MNSGHRADEIELAPLMATPTERPLPQVTTHTLPNGRKIHLFAGGAMANLTAGEGDSLNAFDITLAAMTAGIAHIVGEGARAGGRSYTAQRRVELRLSPSVTALSSIDPGRRLLDGGARSAIAVHRMGFVRVAEPDSEHHPPILASLK